MEIRYVGFEQRQNHRAYKFNVREEGMPARETTVTADMEFFRLHHVGIQEGPSLSGNKLTADLKSGWTGRHELTSADIGAYASAKLLAEAQRAEMRKTQNRRSPPTSDNESPWRNSAD